ncbi:MAG TPA: 6-phosphogluconolactonase [Steroidobacteraceae bacterium]|jgi:6-phosphogluconolactonase|nr:6-phosphogluconolactonase [Steroidobacteraceae bacterium]
MAQSSSDSTHERRFPDAAALTEALCAEIVASLQEGLAAGRGASLVVPGGHTPVALFERLSNATLDWSSVWVTLTDERWVDAHNSASNEHLVRAHLLRNAAAKAQFVGLKSAHADPHSAVGSCWSAIAELPRPFDFVLLGMGDDGHVASLFPDSPGLPAALDLSQPPGCAVMTGPSPPRTRMTLNLRALLDARRIAVLIVGASKWSTCERARARGPALDMPVRALFAQQNVPVTVWWAP